MGESVDNNSREGGKGQTVLLFFIVFFTCLLWVVYSVCTPQNLEEIGGYQSKRGAPPRDLALVIKKSLEMGHSLTISEAEVNRWLAGTLIARQGGGAAPWVSLDGVWARLMDGYVEIIQERRVLGLPFTVSMFVSLEHGKEDGRAYKQAHLHRGPYLEGFPRPVRGGRFGRLEVPQGFLVFVMPSYRNLAAQFRDELKLGVEEMSATTFEKGRLKLVPHAKPEP